MKLQQDLREFVALLNSHEVEFLVVGGHAVAFHGHPRFTGDIDFLLRPSVQNAARVLNALQAFGFGDLSLSAEDFVKPGNVVQLGRPPNRIDLLTSISGVEFDDAWASRAQAELDGLPVCFLGWQSLIENKQASGRPKDLADVAKGPGMAKSIALAADPSRLASLLLSYIPAVCAFVAPRQPGASAAIIDRLSHSRALSSKQSLPLVVRPADKLFQAVAADERPLSRSALPLAFAAEHRYVGQSRGELRKHRNLAAHPTDRRFSPDDATDLLDFVTAICEYVFVLTPKFESFMARAREANNAPTGNAGFVGKEPIAPEANPLGAPNEERITDQT